MVNMVNIIPAFAFCIATVSMLAHRAWLGVKAIFTLNQGLCGGVYVGMFMCALEYNNETIRK